MKKLIICGLALLMATGVMAQWGYHGGRYYARPRVSIGVGFGVPVYPYYGFSPFYGYSPYYGYSPFGYGYGYGNGYGNRYYSSPSKLDLQIEEIRNNYANQIWMAKHDKTIHHKERKKKVHELEHERDQAIIDAKKAYYEKPPRRHNFNSNSNNN
jgi:hypothetical protein